MDDRKSVFGTNRTVLLFAVLLALWTGGRLMTLATAPPHPDPREALLLEEVARVRRGEPPTLFHWPGTPWTVLLAAASSALSIETTTANVRMMRLMTLPFGLAVLILLYRIARWILPPSRAVVVPLLLAIAPAFASGEANVGLVDLPALAFGLLALLLAKRAEHAAQQISSSTFHSLASGLCLGIGIAFKLPTLLVAAPVMLLLSRPKMGAVRRIGAFALGTAGGILFGCPFLVLSPKAVLADLGYELAHYGRGHFGLVRTANDHLWTPLIRHFEAFGWAIGPGVVAVGLVIVVAVGATARKRLSSTALIVAVWFLLSAGAIVVHRFSFPRHWLAVVPPFLILVLAGIEALPDPLRRWGQGFLFVAALHAAATTLALDGIARQPSTILASEAYLREVKAASPGLRISPGPEAPILGWLYPPLMGDFVETAHPEEADIFVIAELEETLQTRIAEEPDTYRDEDFFPLSREDFTTGAFFTTLKTSEEVVTVKRFEPAWPSWTRIVPFVRRNLAFPLNALAHPSIRIDARRSPAKPLRELSIKTEGVPTDDGRRRRGSPASR